METLSENSPPKRGQVYPLVVLIGPGKGKTVLLRESSRWPQCSIGYSSWWVSVHQISPWLTCGRSAEVHLGGWVAAPLLCTFQQTLGAHSRGSWIPSWIISHPSTSEMLIQAPLRGPFSRRPQSYNVRQRWGGKKGWKVMGWNTPPVHLSSAR